VKSRPWPCRLSLRRRSDRLCGAHAVTLLIVWRCKWTSDPIIAFEYSHRVSKLARPTVAHMEEGIDNGCGLLLFRMTDTTRKSATSVNFGSAIGGDHGIGTVHRNADR
jgi:hypothetical protein